MKKLLVIATGGTIASRVSVNGLAPGIPLEQMLDYVPQIRQCCKIDSVQLMNLDSTNMQPNHWLDIAATIYEAYEQYDGFVILHGTDTLAYTAAALSYLIQNSPKPIVLTGSQKPIDQDISDAKSNITQSVLYASDPASRDVNIVFNGEVIVGTRGRKVRTKSFNAFSSIDFPHKAVIRDHKIIRYIQDSTENDSGKQQLQYYDRLDSKVFVLKLIPGVTADVFTYLKDNYSAIVIEGFGIGGIPFIDELGFVDKIHELLDNGKVVVLTTQVPMEGSDFEVYEAGRIFKKDTRIIEAYNMTLEAIVTKLMWVLGQTKNEQEIRNKFYQQINYDILL